MIGDDQKRVFIAIALSIGVLFGWTMLFGPDEEEGAAPDAGAAAGDAGAGAGAMGSDAGAVVAKEPGSDPAPTEPGSEEPPKPVAKEIPKRDVTIETEAFRATFSNEGGVLREFHVLEPEQYQPRGDLIAPVEDPEKPVTIEHFPFATTAIGGTIAVPEKAMYKVVSESETSVSFRYTDPGGHFALVKTYTTSPDLPNSFKLAVALENVGTQPLADQIAIATYGYQPAGEGGWSPLNPIPNVLEGICYAQEDVERADLDDAVEAELVQGPVTWGGTNDRYFMVALTADGEPFEACDFSLVEERYLRTEIRLPKAELAAGQTKTWEMSTYVGPKDVDQLAAFTAPLGLSVDYGVFAFLCRPIRWLLVFYYGLVGNWGLAIILLTITLRTLMFPVNQKGYKNMEGMRSIQKPMEEIREKYKNDPMKMQEKMMGLYKEHNVSPFGCLPQLLQIPIFFALYRTIYSSVELYHADFVLFYTDLSAPDPYYILPVLVGVAMFGQQLLMPVTGTNPQMKYAMYAMPIVFSAFTFVLPSGLALYILVSVFLGVAQQYVIRRGSKAREAARAGETSKGDKGGGDASESKKKKKKKKKGNKGGAKAKA